MNNMDIEWEQIEQPKHAGYLWRAKTFGGWLVKHVDDVMTYHNDGYNGMENTEGYEWRSSITFVPDPKHEWK